MRKKLYRFVILLLAGGYVPAALIAQQTFPKIDPLNISIVRDSFGIPHIFTKTDAEAAYGLAWANAEDAFSETQSLVYIGKGYMGRTDGIEGAKADFFVHAIDARKLVDDHYDADLSEGFKKYIDGFVQGVNAYAAAHPDEVKTKGAFPATAKDILTAYVVIMSFLSRAQDAIGEAVDGKYDTVPAAMLPEKIRKPAGSNAFALSGSKTVDGKTMICINPHMAMEGGLSFYEAQLQSEEGLNIEGALFQGTSSVNMGANESLGWGMTWNFFDRLDVYKLNMHPSKKLLYEFDGQYYKLEKHPVWLKVGLGKKHKFVIPVKMTTYWSKYGCTVKSGKGNYFYSLRFPANQGIRSSEQLYRMNKARNIHEFWDALRIHAIVLFNVIYADKENNIFYLEHGTLPERNNNFDYKGLVAGNTSKTLWTKLLPLDSMPYNLNPSCGYVFNTNNSPFHSSGKECVGYCAYPNSVVDELPGDNNRANRFTELIGAKDKFSLDDLRKIKFDVTLSHKGGFGQSIESLFALDENKYPDLKEALTILKTWNRTTEIHECAPTILGMVIRDIFTRRGYDDNPFVSGFKVTDEEWVSGLRKACDTLKAWFGTVKVEWGTVQRNIRGDKNLPLRGFADVLSPSYPQQVPGTKTFKPEYGDTYTMFAAFGKNGLEKLQALQPLGNSLNPKSKHYNDQMELFSRQELRPLSLKKEDVLKKAEKIYHPQ